MWLWIAYNMPKNPITEISHQVFRGFVQAYQRRQISSLYSKSLSRFKIASSVIFVKVTSSVILFIYIVILFCHMVLQLYCIYLLQLLTLSWRRSLAYRNQPIDLQSKPMDWFLYDTTSVMKESIDVL